MIKLKKLKLKNFKSFQTADIPLNKGFTVVAGANGSGKSNILDGLLFSLGATSLKLLRASKLTDFLNNNAVENYAKVEIEIGDGKRSWIISRIIDNKGKSVFRINNDRKTLNEIQSLLGELGIRNDGYNIVAQGDVTRIIQRSALERRQIVDEVAGLAEFDSKKEEAEKELGKVDSKIKDVTIILNERDAILQKLEDEMNAAKEFKEIEEKQFNTKATIIALEIEKIEKEINSIEKKLDETIKKKEEKEKKIEELRTNINEGRNRIEEITKELLESGKQTYTQILSVQQEKKGLINLANQKIDSAKKEIEYSKSKQFDLEKKIELLEREKNDFGGKTEKLQGEITVLQKEIDSFKKQHFEIKKDFDNVKDKLETKEKELENIIENIEKHNKELYDFDLEVEKDSREKR